MFRARQSAAAQVLCDPRKRTHNRQVGVLLGDGLNLLLIFLDCVPEDLQLAHELLHKERCTRHHCAILCGPYGLANLLDEFVNISRTGTGVSYQNAFNFRRDAFCADYRSGQCSRNCHISTESEEKNHLKI